MAQGRPNSKEEAGSQRGVKAGGEDEVYKGHFPGQKWMRWESVEQRKMGWQDLWSMEESRISFLIRSTWSMEESRISFLIRSTYDVLPSPQNLPHWHILTGCKVALSQGLFTWCHDQAL